MASLVQHIDDQRISEGRGGGLSSALRVYVLNSCLDAEQNGGQNGGQDGGQDGAYPLKSP